MLQLSHPTHFPFLSFNSPLLFIPLQSPFHSNGPRHHLHYPLPMSTTPPPPLLATATTTTTTKPYYSLSRNLASLGLGYAIATALGFLVLLSTILLASYICYRSAAARRQRQRQAHNNPNTLNSSNENSIYLPRIVFVAEDDNDNENTISNENVVVGLDEVVINSYPKFTFTKKTSFVGNDAVCSICLCEYREPEVLRMLPDCRHCFHLMCVDPWLKLNASCPVCRTSPLPTPLSTPLQEVVPLSQYDGGRRRQ